MSFRGCARASEVVVWIHFEKRTPLGVRELMPGGVNAVDFFAVKE